MAVNATTTVESIGDFDISELEKPYEIQYELDSNGKPNLNKPLPAKSTNALGMMYRSTAGVSKRAKELGDLLATLTQSKDDNGNKLEAKDDKGNKLETKDDNGNKLEVDNPLVLARITAASGNYNMARQLQSNLMKSIKDTAQAIGRNV